MNRLLLILLVVSPATGAYAQSTSRPNPDGSREVTREEAIKLSGEDLRDLSIAQVPANIMQVVKRTAPDVYFDSAISYLVKDFRVYRVSGRLFREVWHVHVREDGKLLRTESDNRSD